MQKVKIFKTHVNELKDTNSLESSLNLFVQEKKIISVTFGKHDGNFRICLFT